VETVLLVDDEVYLRNMAAEVLVMNGYTVLAAAGPSEALRIGEMHRGPIDLLLTDVVMPEMSGFGLADRLRAARPGLRVLYVSGYVDSDAIGYRVQEGGAALLMKPFTPEALARRVREVLDVPAPGAASTHGPASCARGN
jgi:CheY-like chemotaxis protein